MPILLTSSEEDIGTEDPVQDASRSVSNPVLISVAVAGGSLVIFTVLLVIACATGIIVKQRKKMSGYVINRGVAISNEEYMNRHSGQFIKIIVDESMQGMQV